MNQVAARGVQCTHSRAQCFREEHGEVTRQILATTCHLQRSLGFGERCRCFQLQGQVKNLLRRCNRRKAFTSTKEPRGSPVSCPRTAALKWHTHNSKFKESVE